MQHGKEKTPNTFDGLDRRPLTESKTKSTNTVDFTSFSQHQPVRREGVAFGDIKLGRMDGGGAPLELATTSVRLRLLGAQLRHRLRQTTPGTTGAAGRRLQPERSARGSFRPDTGGTDTGGRRSRYIGDV